MQSVAQSDRAGGGKTLIRQMNPNSVIGRNSSGIGDGIALPCSPLSFSFLANTSVSSWLTGLTFPTGGTAGQYFRKESGTNFDWAWATIAADEISYDNTTSGLTATDVQAAIDEISIYELNDLADVDTTGVADTNVLAYNSVSGNWEPATAGGGGGGSGVDVKDEGTAIATATTLNFTGAGVTATDAGSGQVDVAVKGSFTGAVIYNSFGISSSGHASKGGIFIPDRDITIDAVYGIIDPTPGAFTYTAFIVELASVTGDEYSGPTAAGNITAVKGTTDEFSLDATDPRVVKFTLVSAAVLEKDKIYAILITTTEGTGTTGCRLALSTTNGTMRMNAPGKHYWGLIFFDTVSPSIGDSPSLVNGGNMSCVWLEGTF